MEKKQNPLFFTGSSHAALAQEIVAELGIPLGRISLNQFPDGETGVEILEDVRGRTVYVLQSTGLNPNFYLVELLIMIDALKRSSAKEIIAIIPYYGYCRQDRKDKPGMPITAKLIANMLSASGVSRLITFDLHAGQLEGFFEIPVDHLHCQALLAKEALMAFKNQPFVVVAPDLGSVKIVEKMAKMTSSDVVVIEKQRINTLDIKMRLIGSVASKNVLIVDDICSTAGTLCAAAELCKQNNAKEIVAVVTHGICTGNAIQKIEDSPLTSLILTNSVPIFERFKAAIKITTVSLAPLIAKMISQEK
ncbi:MAG: ribose-phosphate diphosphokinase [Parachlamydiaceae bacterium]|nr:ribose-phosphate diphosphokinase [Parachlamydiaceae bacterium]